MQRRLPLAQQERLLVGACIKVYKGRAAYSYGENLRRSTKVCTSGQRGLPNCTKQSRCYRSPSVCALPDCSADPIPDQRANRGGSGQREVKLPFWNRARCPRIGAVQNRLFQEAQHFHSLKLTQCAMGIRLRDRHVVVAGASTLRSDMLHRTWSERRLSQSYLMRGSSTL